MVFERGDDILQTMKHGGKWLTRSGYAALGLACCTGNLEALTVETGDNPYTSIVERNVFALKPPPPAPDPNAQAGNVPVPKIFLTGITTILGNKRALLKTPPPQGKPGEGPKGEQSFILAEGQRDGDLEVLEIDEKAGAVKVKFGDTIVPLNFADNGVKIAATGPPPMPMPGLPGAPGAVMPSALPQAAMSSYARPMRGVAVSSGQPNMPAGMGGTPVSGMGLGGVPTQQPTANQTVHLPPEQQMIVMEVERERIKHAVASGDLPPLPPTELTPSEPTVNTRPNQNPSSTLPRLPGMGGFPPPFPR